MDYQQFLDTKRRAARPAGFDAISTRPELHDWQNAIVEWACERGRAAVFANTGLGKTRIQLAWAETVARHTGRPVILAAPLSIARQTVREGRRIGIDVEYVRSDQQPSDGLWITNYEMLDRFDADNYVGVVLDESSILKNFEGKTRSGLISKFSTTPHRLACTATPAPNDVSELTNHAEFLGVMPRNEMLAAYFIHDDTGWRLKGHAAEPMYAWMATWSVALRLPADIGGDNAGYILPPLDIQPAVVAVELDQDGQLFPTDLGGVGGRLAVRRTTLAERVNRAAELVDHQDQAIIWCGLNEEADTVTKAIGDQARNVYGTMTPDEKAELLEAFQDGEYRVLVTKPSIAGFGMNFQNAHRMVFLGLSDSYESYYQAIRRCWRYGQQHNVRVDIVVSGLETQIVDNVRRKEAEAGLMTDRLIAAMKPIWIKEHTHA